MGNSLSTRVEDVDEESYSGWMEAAGMIPVRGNNLSHSDHAPYQAMPLNQHSTEPYMAQTSAASRASSLVYQTPPANSPYIPEPHGTLNHPPTPPQIIYPSTPAIHPAGLEGIASESVTHHTPNVEPISSEFTPVRLSSIEDPDTLQTLPQDPMHGPANASIQLPSGLRNRRSSLRRSSVNNRTDPRHNQFSRNVRFRVPMESEHRISALPIRTPSLSTIADSPPSGSSAQRPDDTETPPEIESPVPTEYCPTAEPAVAPSALSDEDDRHDTETPRTARSAIGHIDTPTASHPHLYPQTEPDLGPQDDASDEYLESPPVIPPIFPPAAQPYYHGGVYYSCSLNSFAHSASSSDFSPTIVPPPIPYAARPAQRETLTAAFIPVIPQYLVYAGHSNRRSSRPADGDSEFYRPSETPNRGVLYANMAAAAGFGVGTPYRSIIPYQQATTVIQSQPVYNEQGAVQSPHFTVLAYRGIHQYKIDCDPSWDDAQLFKEIRKAYDRLRSWRKWCSLKGMDSIILVSSQNMFVFPQRIGSVKVSPRQHMRIRYLLNHPEMLQTRDDFIRTLSDRAGIGIEFVERWEARRWVVAVLVPVFFSLLASLVYAWITKDVSTAFTIGSYITSASSLILALVGILGYVDL